MKFTLSWLKEYLETDATPEQICERLTAIGLELESYEDPAKEFAAFKVAEVLDAKPHPDADKLQILTVKTDSNAGMQVVCGAPNARAGMKGIFAPSGTYVPGLDVTLKKAQIRGVESNGMMASERELCLSDEHEGIIDLPTSLEIGTSLSEIYGLDDPIIEIGLTPNRADCAGVYGIARDLAAAGLGTLKKHDTKSVKSNFKSEISVNIEDEDGCPHFIAREIKGLTNKPSRLWLQRRLKAIGLRPISALVDITNYFTHGYSRPLHVYDANKIKGNLSVRAATGKEELSALNDHDYTLTKNAIGIYDDNGVIGLGGIVGGTSTSCEEDTVNIILEAAYFNPVRIARTGRDMGVITDARYRFERGVDPEFTSPAIEMATRMILDICGSEDSQVSEVIENGKRPSWIRHITYKPSLMETLVGIEVSSPRQLGILQSLGFHIEDAMLKNGPYEVAPPSWRGDIFGAADLAEEIVRIVGLENIPSKSIHSKSSVPVSAETPTLERGRKSRTALATRGMMEAITWSFMREDHSKLFGLDDDKKRNSLKLKNAISSDISVMRPSILPNLIQAATRNAAQGYARSALFEVGPIFDGVKPDDQQITISGIRAGDFEDRHWDKNNANRSVSMYDAKADALAALDAAGAPASTAQIKRGAPDYYHPGRSGAICLGKNVLAYFGEIHPSALDALDTKQTIVGFEIFFDAFPPVRTKGTEKKYLTLEPLQPVRKDFAFIIDTDKEAENVARAAKAADKSLITDASIFDIYTGKGVEEGKKSVALCVTLQPKGASLDDKSLEDVTNKIIAIVEKKAGGTLRN